MSASLQLEGVAELRRALEDASDDLVDRTIHPVIAAAAQGLAEDVRQAYAAHAVTGKLANTVMVDDRVDARGLRASVRAKAKHAHLYEYGTVRRVTNSTGANRGTMPAQPTFVPAAVRWRARMVEQVRSAMRSWRVPGFTGTPEVRG